MNTKKIKDEIINQKKDNKNGVEIWEEVWEHFS